MQKRRYLSLYSTAGKKNKHKKNPKKQNLQKNHNQKTPVADGLMFIHSPVTLPLSS